MFRGNPPSGTGTRVEYVRYDHANSQLLYNCVINNTGNNIIGNLLSTAPSDERLKTDIQDFNDECSECVKNVKLKTFKFKDEKYKDNDNYGFIAQEIQKELPEYMKGIVREVQDRDRKEKILTIDYMRLSLVLWKSLQEEMVKREHIESRLFELEDAVKELKGKGRTKPKA